MSNLAVLTSEFKDMVYESYEDLLQENALLRQEIREARKAAEITADLVVKQFEETERVLHRFQVANAQRKRPAKALPVPGTARLTIRQKRRDNGDIVIV